MSGKFILTTWTIRYQLLEIVNKNRKSGISKKSTILYLTLVNNI